MIIGRYIMREIIKPTVTICTVLMFIFGCYISTRYGEDAVHGLLPGSTVLQMILLRVVIALEVLLPTTPFGNFSSCFNRLPEVRGKMMIVLQPRTAIVVRSRSDGEQNDLQLNSNVLD